jgi:hypothetical protein
MPLILGTNSIKDTGYNVANSLRFDDGSSDYLSRTPSSASNRRTWTFSTWVKLGNIGTEKGLLHSESDSNNFTAIRFSSDHRFKVLSARSGSTANGFYLITTRLFRDPSAWYHIVVAVDTTLGTATNRVRIYVNGVEETAFDTDDFGASQNYDTDINATSQQNVGDDNSGFHDGYLCETVLVDGQQLDATSFGEFDEDSPTIWKPKDVSGLTFGTNGFYLDFENSGSLGADVSGNGNNFTVNNLTSIDQSTDTCTNNFITMNPLNATLGSVTLSEGNLKASLNGNYQVFGTINVTSGKWYWEQKVGSSNLFISVADGNRAAEDTGTGLLNRDYAWAYRSDGVKQHDNTTASYGDSFTTNDIIGVALDMDNGFIYFSKNGTFQNSGDPTSGSTGTGAAYSGLHTDAAAPDGLTPCLGQYSGDQITTWNFGSPPYSISSGNTDGNGFGNFEYAVPSGYYSLNSKNLAEFG